MVFYKIEANISQGHGENEGLTEEERGCLPYELFEKSDALFQKSGQRNIIFTTVIRRKTATFAMAVKDVFCVERLIEQYLKFFPFEIKKLHIDEVTFSTFTTLLHGADRNGYIRDEF